MATYDADVVNPETPVSTGDKEILAEARRRFKLAVEADEENRIQALDDVKFAWNDNNYQWPAAILRLRQNRPCLTENRLPQFIRQVVNTQRANRPSIDISPASGDASVQVAEVIEGMIRHIEQYSKADLAYDSAFESAVSAGVGYFRVNTDYCDDNSFDQEIVVKAIDNQFSVYDDPHYTQPDGSDRRFCFVTEMVDRDEFKEKYGIEPATVNNQGIDTDEWNQWYDEDDVRVAEYWRVIETRKTIADPMDPKQKREVVTRVVEQYLMTGSEIIQPSKWQGIYIPIIPVFGEVKNIEGEKKRKSLIRDAKDMQRINNYWLSTETESVALQPKTPFIGALGAFKSDTAKWETAHAQNHPYIEYDPVPGEQPPQRQQPPQFPAAVRETRMGAIESMKSIMGLYDASMGAKTNETSGIAIQQRQEQGDASTYHFIDNMSRALRYAGWVIIDLLPKIYTGPRVVRIIQPDDQADMVAINQIFIDPRTGQQGMLPLNVGKYDVVVKAGPSFQTQRQEAARAITEMVRAFPPILQQAGDLLVKNLDFPDADKVAERLKPPDPQGPNPQQMQQQMQQMQQGMQQMQQQIEQGKQVVTQLQQVINSQQLDLQRKDIEKAQMQLALKDKSSATQIDLMKQRQEIRQFVVDTVLELAKLQQTQAQPIGPEVTNLETTAEQLVQ